MRRCSNGHEVADGEFQYCPICGERLEPAAVEPEPQEASPVVSELSLAFGPSSTAAEAFGEPPPKARRPVTVDALRGKWPVSVRRTIAGVFALFAIVFIVGLVFGSSNKSGSPSAPTIIAVGAARSCSSYPGARPVSCISKTGTACSGYGAGKPNDCYGAKQLRARIAAHKAQLLAAAKARRAAAKAKRLGAQRGAAAAAAPPGPSH